MSIDVTPQSLQDVWDWTRNRFAAHDGAHTDAILLQFGDRVSGEPPATLDDASQLALAAWRVSGPNNRHMLAHLFMRMVGHEAFPD